MCLRSRWAHPFCVASLGVYPLRVITWAGGCSCAGCACEANHQGGGLKRHGPQDTGQGKLMGGPNASGQLDFAHTFGQQRHVLCFEPEEVEA